jgi:hypothetical protein
LPGCCAVATQPCAHHQHTLEPLVEESACRFGIWPWLNDDVRPHVVLIPGSSKPMLHAKDSDEHCVQLALVSDLRTVAASALPELAAAGLRGQGSRGCDHIISARHAANGSSVSSNRSTARSGNASFLGWPADKPQARGRSLGRSRVIRLAKAMRLKVRGITLTAPDRVARPRQCGP